MFRPICAPAISVFLTTAAVAAQTNAPTFTEDVVPILYTNCVTCHRPGDIAPMSLLTYTEVRPWAKSIRNAVIKGDMPPWDASPESLPLANDISLNNNDVQTIVQWVDGGAPQGPPSAMPDAPDLPAGWKLGEPDYILDMGTFDVPAEGEDLFITKAVRLDIPEDRWLTAVEVRPGDKRVLHHLVGFRGYFEMNEGTNLTQGVEISDRDRREVSVFNVWAAGTPPKRLPDGMGYLLESGQLVSFNIHYHPYGQATTDHSLIGLHFSDEPLEYPLTTGFAANSGIVIPPGADGVEYSASYVFPYDVRLVSFFPHMHQRGKSMTYTLTTPDNVTKTILDVSRYDFNWQWNYLLEQPVVAPKGSRLDIYATWDNSEDNPNNPDPSQTVFFGDGTNFEMLIGFFEFVPRDPDQRVRQTSAFTAPVLAAAHPPSETYLLEARAGLGRLHWAAHVPNQGKPGTFYLIQGEQILTITPDEIDFRGDGKIAMLLKVVRDAGRTAPGGVFMDVSDPRNVTGGVYFGRPVPDNPSPESADLAFTGHRMDYAPAVSNKAKPGV